jgi:hypothetical protein
MRNAYKILLWKHEGNRPSENLGGNGIILKWILGK